MKYTILLLLTLTACKEPTKKCQVKMSEVVKLEKQVEQMSGAVSLYRSQHALCYNQLQKVERLVTDYYEYKEN